MSILAKNLKTIRKELRCTQSMMADILKVGFRTYVRYEAGERDAPVSILVKIARLGNISLEQLLTTEVNKSYISPVKAINKKAAFPEVRTVNFRSGLVAFKKPSKQEMITVDDSERKLVSIFRKMDSDLQTQCLATINKVLKEGKGKSRNSASAKKKTPARAKKKAAPRVLAKRTRTAAKSLKNVKKKKPGRKKVDKKVLKEKIDKLKMITRSVQKITVR